MKKRMTVGQLAKAVSEGERIFLCSLYDISREVELTMELKAYTGILTLEILSLSHTEEGYTAVVDLPAAAIAALDSQH